MPENEENEPLICGFAPFGDQTPVDQRIVRQVTTGYNAIYAMVDAARDGR